MLFPVLLQLGDGETLEKVLASLEVVFQRAAQQALAEPARAAEEDKLRFEAHPIYKLCLVNIDASVLTDALEVGDAGGVESHFFHNRRISSCKDSIILLKAIRVSLNDID